MRTGTHLAERGKIGNAAHPGNTTGMGKRGADIVNQLLPSNFVCKSW